MRTVIFSIIYGGFTLAFCLYFPPAWDLRWSAIIAVFSAQAFGLGRWSCK
jgi:hypothetical protein